MQNEISVSYIIPILSITVTGISVAFGLANYNLRNIMGNDPTFKDLIKFMLIELFSFSATFLVHQRILLDFLRSSFLNKYIFYIGISIYFFLSIFLPILLNRVLMVCKFPVKLESHMLIYFPNLISSCYRRSNKISEYQYYRQIQLIHSLIMSATAVYLNQRTIFFPKLMMSCTNQKDLEKMYIVKYCINTVLGVSSLLFIVEIIFIEFGYSFLDFAFKKASEENSSSYLCKVSDFNTDKDCKREDLKHLCTLNIKIIKKYRRNTF